MLYSVSYLALLFSYFLASSGRGDDDVVKQFVREVCQTNESIETGVQEVKRVQNDSLVISKILALCCTYCCKISRL
jgi:hypothetical protein